MPGEFYTFEEVLKELQIDEKELRKMISQGEIHAFRDAAGMKFKKADVERVKKARETEPTIILTDSDAEIKMPSEEELVVDEGAKGKETVMDIDVFETEEMPTLVRPPAAPGKAVGKEPEAETIPTVPLEKADEGAPTVAEPVRRGRRAAKAEEEFETISPARVGSGRISRSARLRMLQLKRKKSHIIWTVILFITVIFVLMSGPFIFNEMRSVSPQYAVDLSDKVRGLADWFFSFRKD
jgi:hypothetical protein